MSADGRHRGWHRARRRRASLAGVLLCLLAWMPLPLGLASAHMAAGWTQVCTSEGVTTVLLEENGGESKQPGTRHCTECWGQAPDHEPGPPPLAPVLFQVVSGGGDVPATGDEVFPRALFRFQLRSRAPPAFA